MKTVKEFFLNAASWQPNITSDERDHCGTINDPTVQDSIPYPATQSKSRYKRPSSSNDLSSTYTSHKRHTGSDPEQSCWDVLTDVATRQAHADTEALDRASIDTTHTIDRATVTGLLSDVSYSQQGDTEIGSHSINENLQCSQSNRCKHTDVIYETSVELTNCNDAPGHVNTAATHRSGSEELWDITKAFRASFKTTETPQVMATNRSARPADRKRIKASEVKLPQDRSSSLGLVFFKTRFQFVTLPESTEWISRFDPPPMRPRLPLPPVDLLEKPWGNISDSFNNSGKVKPDGIAYLNIPLSSWLPDVVLDWSWRTSTGIDLHKNKKKIVQWTGYSYDNAAVREQVTSMSAEFGAVWMGYLENWLIDMEEYICRQIQYDQELVRKMAVIEGVRWFEGDGVSDRVDGLSLTDLCIHPRRMDFMSLLRAQERQNLGNDMIVAAVENVLQTALAEVIKRGKAP